MWIDRERITEDQAMFLAEGALHDDCHGHDAEFGDGEDEYDVPEFD
jgi:hypothetical protein